MKRFADYIIVYMLYIEIYNKYYNKFIIIIYPLLHLNMDA